ncbi:5-carboxymethylaminomethyluridine-tRNA synthase MnmEG, GTPase component [Campylobacter pinnipediorum subsp. pinnipediorum]|uniref:tRNA uridine-5-carboxymethylaminomethyl(34) synthesis GTPase MnmE n=1 Tax=Campylobacter pinnipediorum TaxID=1965231 RepID=UPI0009958E9B|nr:tRNA uridine-5-carboxymethylaminomethyl(34) synthesis GTPase MnmE [Campylobacter pinnipediorum]AQW84342.1 5-carboxymethylaminomethyluridine-tRNA synthase MnmEG, GTPase component [Campylobacter pinnipediorum subsp. pinnipediorum]
MTSLKNDTIVATATAHGAGSVSIIRMSGFDSLKIAKKLIKKDELTPRYATLCKIYSLDNSFMDEGLIIYFKAPNSFTGEDIVEFQIHGGFTITDMLLNELIKAGARLANPGEFSKRAFLNDKIDLLKANAISAMINARSQSAVKILARQMKGELKEYVENIRLDLIKTLAYVETSIDYADDDLPEDIIIQIKQMLVKNSQSLDKIVQISKQRSGLIDGFKIAIVGKPNVGKSSILNSLLKYERAIVSNEAGTTRDTIEEELKIETHIIKIIDTAGIRENTGAIEEIGISYTLRAIKEADIILAVFDASSKATEQDKQIIKLINDSDKQIFFILNKIDLDIKFDLDLKDPIKISANDSVDEILSTLNNFLNNQDTSELMLSSVSQINACANASMALKNGLELMQDNELELFAYELNKAIKNIADITKPVEYSELLDEMFSNFCLGK